MKRLIAVLSLILCVGAAHAQQTPKDDYNTVREFKGKIFVIQNRSPRMIFSTIRALGSGFKGAEMMFNEELHTVTVRDFPENIATIEEAIKRLDVAAPAEPDMEIKIAVLIGSKTPLAGASVPDELAGVVKQLQSTLSYSHYGLLTATVHRTKTGTGIEGSGVAEPTLLGMTPSQSRPIIYNYNLRTITAGQSTIEVGNFQFSMKVPIDVGRDNIQYQSVGFETPVSIRQGEKVVIGTTTMGSKALIVVVQAKVNP